MATGDILTKTSSGTLTITLASLGNAAAKQSTVVSNSGNYPAAIIYVKMTSGGTGPTASSTYDIFLGRSNSNSSPSYRSDGAGASDATITTENAKALGSIILTNNTAKAFYGEFDTSGLGPLGPEWFIIIRNSSGQTISATAGDHEVTYNYYYPQVQS